MPNIRTLLGKALPPLETPQEREARMTAFHVKHPRLAAAAMRVPEPGWRTEANGYGEGVIDDD